MKTTITLPNRLFERAEALASSLGINRSQLYTDAVRAYLEPRQEEAIRAELVLGRR